MATGGIFQLITNDGKQDRMLMASALLASRIAAARNNRKCAGLSDCTPTLYDIERTHILFTSAHFKPFAAIGYEYNKVTPTAGAVTLNESSTQSVTFSIPQFGDFFCDMVVHVTLEQPSIEYPADLEPSRQNLYRWCSYPGERILRSVKFDVNGNPLDQYYTDAVNFHREFLVQPNKAIGWDRCMGQEEIEDGFVRQPNWESSGLSATDINYRTMVFTTSGLQTPTGKKLADVNNDGKQDRVELFIPLLFWCNKDPRLAVPSVAIPYGQRFITLELAPWRDLIGVVPRGYSSSESESVYNNLDKYGKLNGNDILKNIELYINNIFVNPEVHNIFIKRIGFTLIRVHRQQNFDVTDGLTDNSVLLQNLKWPIESMFVGLRIKSYSRGSNEQLSRNLSNWYKFHKVQTVTRSQQGWVSGKLIKNYTGANAFDTFAIQGYSGGTQLSGDFVVNQFSNFKGLQRVQFGDISDQSAVKNPDQRLPLRLYFETFPEIKTTVVNGVTRLDVVSYNAIEDFLPKLLKPNDILTFDAVNPASTTNIPVKYKIQVSRIITGVWEQIPPWAATSPNNTNESLWFNVNKGYAEFVQYSTDLNGVDLTPLFARVKAEPVNKLWYNKGDLNVSYEFISNEFTPQWPSSTSNDTNHQVWYPNQPTDIITSYHKRAMEVNIEKSIESSVLIDINKQVELDDSDLSNRLRNVGYAFNDISKLGSSGSMFVNLGNLQMTNIGIWQTDASSLESYVDVAKPTLEYITIKAHGIPIYNNFPAKFYNAYIPYNYGGHNIRVPKDIGALMITFCLYPGTYQPSGHINVSRAREFYIDFRATGWIGNDPSSDKETGSMTIVASAINFLLISDGSAVLRYST